MPLALYSLAVFGVLSGGPGNQLSPSNEGAQVKFVPETGKIEIAYDSKVVLAGILKSAGGLVGTKISVRTQTTFGPRHEVTQDISIDSSDGKSISLSALANGSSESFAAETLGAAQAKFKLVRNSIGLSANGRNNAIYDRTRDWMLESTDGVPGLITPLGQGEKNPRFGWTLNGPSIHFKFRPLYYQKHKNLPYFHPWEKSVWKGSVTGWCSWWAYFDSVREQDVLKVSEIFSTKLKDFGYKYIQIDDGYQSGNGGLPKDWLNTNEKFPHGLAILSKSISNLGLDPALWINVHFGDEDYVKAHPNYFIQNADGTPHKGPWIDYGLNGAEPEAIANVVTPTHHALHEMGWKYIKVDALRHLLYDSTYPCRDVLVKKGVAPEEAYRNILKAMRKELGESTYMLACWGVLPEAIGIADGCRLGGDGFGPSTLQQYTSWNNVVWRNDPDHCDVKPFDRKTGKYIDGEEKIRPVLVSMAGGQLLLSDKPEVYEDDANLEGVKRASPILFTIPGQLYDYDPIKTNNLIKGLRNENGGANSGPIDADQKGEVCPWWMLDINEPYEKWAVLTHMNWTSDPMGESQVKFSDLGLANATYAVFEFWSKRYLGDFNGIFTAKALDPKDLATYAIRRVESHPQILSTSRHITQGAQDFVNVKWSGHTLSGSSRVVKGDPYSIFVRIPRGFTLNGAKAGVDRIDVRVEDSYAEVKLSPTSTGTVSWSISF